MILPLHFQSDDPRSGRSVSVPFGPYRHYGVLFVLDGRLWVFANSDACGGARLESWEQFSGGKPWRFEPDYEGSLDWRAIFRRASSVVRRYDAGRWNCEHFVNYAQGLPVISRQVRATVALLLVGVASFALARAA